MPLSPQLLGSLGASLVALILYTVTLAPDVLAHDSGEWQAAAATLGISHSPGSPAYLLIGHIFTRVPLGTAAARVSFLSAVIGAVGVGAIFAFMMMLFGRWLPAIVSAASLGLAGLWWSNASVATPYNAVPALIVVALILLLEWHRHGNAKVVWLGAFLSGLGLAYHPTFMYFIPVIAAGLVALGPWRKLLRPRALLLTLLCLAAGLSPFIYLPVRSAADPPVKYAEIDSPRAFINYVTAGEARETGHGRLAAPDPGEIKKQFLLVVRDGYYPSYAFLVFAPAVILAHPAAWRVLRRQRRFLLFLLLGLAAHLAIILSLSSIYAQYYMPMILYFSIWAGFSVYLYKVVVNTLETQRFGVVAVAILAASYFGFLGLGVQRVWPLVDHSGDVAMRQYIDEVFRVAEPGAAVMANWESYTGLLYAMKVDGQRQDLELFSVPQDGWAAEVAAIEETAPQILLSHTAPFDPRDSSLVERQLTQSFLSIKGRTYQDYDHGEPFPALVQLFPVKPAAAFR